MDKKTAEKLIKRLTGVAAQFEANPNGFVTEITENGDAIQVVGLKNSKGLLYLVCQKFELAFEFKPASGRFFRVDFQQPLTGLAQLTLDGLGEGAVTNVVEDPEPAEGEPADGEPADGEQPAADAEDADKEYFWCENAEQRMDQTTCERRQVAGMKTCKKCKKNTVAGEKKAEKDTEKATKMREKRKKESKSSSIPGYVAGVVGEFRDQLGYDGQPEKVPAELYCIKYECSCGNVRWLKPQDVFQVKSCKPCKHKSGTRRIKKSENAATPPVAEPTAPPVAEPTAPPVAEKTTKKPSKKSKK